MHADPITLETLRNIGMALSNKSQNCYFPETESPWWMDNGRSDVYERIVRTESMRARVMLFLVACDFNRADTPRAPPSIRPSPIAERHLPFATIDHSRPDEFPA